MTPFSCTCAILTCVIALIELVAMFYLFYFSFFIKKDKTKRDVFFHALGLTSFLGTFVSQFLSCCGFLMGGAYDETGIAWFLMFLAWIVPFIFFFIGFYKTCLDTFQKEQLNISQESEPVER